MSAVMLPSNRPHSLLGPAGRSCKAYRRRTVGHVAITAQTCTVQSRSYIVKPRRPQHRIHVSTASATSVSKRHRSNWMRDMRSFWHRPDCTWVHSDGDPRTTPRDKDCPACQYEVKKPLELSGRELMWERKMESWRHYMEKDPYEALFGRSNERLKGLWTKADEEWRMPWFGRHRGGLGWWNLEEETKKATERTEKHTAAGLQTDRKSMMSEPPTSANSNTKPSHPNQPVLGNPVPVEHEDDLVFDPITMRKVPRKLEKAAPESQTQTENNNGAIVIPVKTFASSQASVEERITPAKSEQRESSSEPIPAPKKASSSFSSSSSSCYPSYPFSPFLPILSHASVIPSSGLVCGELKHKSREFQTGDRIAKFWLSPAKAHIASPMITRSTQTRTNGILPTEEPIKRNDNAKEALEASWIKERNSRRNSLEADVQEAAAMKEQELRQAIDKVNSKTMVSAHFARRATTNDSAIERQSYISNHKRDRPFKHMNAHELGAHRASLLAAWARKSQHKQTSETPAEKLLNAEVSAQKEAMRAFENKPRAFGPLRSEATSAESSKEPPTSDLSLSKSSGGLLAEQEKADGRALGREIRDIYEKAYGLIDTGHQQEALKGSLQEYERTLPAPKYDFKTGQDNLEQELKNAAESPKSGYEESTYYDEKLGSSAYTFTTGQDNLEEELKAISMGSSTKDQAAAAAALEAEKPASNLAEVLETIRQSAPPTTHQSALPQPSKPEPSFPLSRPLLLEGQQSTSDIPLKPAEAQQTGKSSVTEHQRSVVDRHLYRIIAWDIKDKSIHTATASSSFCTPTGNSILPLEAALVRLHEPAAFLPFIEQYQAEGYEVVSASGKLLVMKRNQLLSARGETTLPKLESVVTTMPASPEDTAKLSNSTVGSKTSMPIHEATVPEDDFCMPFPPLEPAKLKPSIHFEPSELAPANQPSRPTTRRKTQRIRKEEPIFSGTRRRWDTDAKASSTDDLIQENAKSEDKNTAEQNRQQQGGNTNGSNPGPDSGSAKSSFVSRAAKVVGVLGACYATGCLIEYSRDRGGPSSGTGGTGGARSSHSSHSSFAPGLTDRAMWRSSPVEPTKNAAKKANVVTEREAQGNGLEWSRMLGWDGREESNGAAKAADDDVNAVTWLGTALCVVSALGLISNLLNGGN